MDPQTHIEERDRAAVDALLQKRWGISGLAYERIAAGLGARRFYRVEITGGEVPSVIARIEPNEATAPEASTMAGPEAPAWLPEPGVEPIRGFLESHALPVPRSFGHDEVAGIDLLEDLGDRTIDRFSGDQRRALYRQAVELPGRLQALHAEPDEVPAFGRFFDLDLLRTKAWKLLHWSWPILLGREARAAEQAVVFEGFASIGAWLDEFPNRLAHRDFKAGNLIAVGADRVAGSAHDDRSLRPIMIDVQGAFMAPPEYDLVCLLYDAQVDLSENFVTELAEIGRQALPDAPSSEQFQHRFDAIALMRLSKDISHFAHAARFRDDDRYWQDIPRGLALIERVCRRNSTPEPAIRALIEVIEPLTRIPRSADEWGRRKR